MDNVNRDIGRLVAAWRKRAGLSQAALADALGTQQATVSKLETGSYRLSVVQLVSVLDACGLTLAEVANEITKAAGTDGRPLWERIDE